MLKDIRWDEGRARREEEEKKKREGGNNNNNNNQVGEREDKREKKEKREREREGGLGLWWAVVREHSARWTCSQVTGQRKVGLIAPK